MTEKKDSVGSYSQDGQLYRRQSLSIQRKSSTTIHINLPSEKYYSNRNCPEILSLLALSNKRLDDREKKAYRAVANDEYNFIMVNYQLQTSSSTSSVDRPLKNDAKTKQPMFPDLTPKARETSTKFPTLISKSISSKDDKKAPMSTITRSSKYASSSTKTTVHTKMPTVSTEKKKKT